LVSNHYSYLFNLYIKVSQGKFLLAYFYIIIILKLLLFLEILWFKNSYHLSILMIILSHNSIILNTLNPSISKISFHMSIGKFFGLTNHLTNHIRIHSPISPVNIIYTENRTDTSAPKTSALPIGNHFYK